MLPLHGTKQKLTIPEGMFEDWRPTTFLLLLKLKQVKPNIGSDYISRFIRGIS